MRRIFFAAAAATFLVPAAGRGQTATFNRDIAPILAAHCWTCHRPGGTAPFSLVTYAEARRRAEQVAFVTGRRIMPPWKPEPGFGTFQGERRLSAREIALIESWMRDGAPEGDPAVLPDPPPAGEAWQLGRPDLVVELPGPYVLNASGRDILRNFVVPIPVSARRYVQGIEFLPRSANVIHHATMRIDRTRGAQQLDEEDPAPGYEGVLPPGARYPVGHFLAWTPGQVRPLAPESAWTLEPDTSLVVQLHLRPTGKPEQVRPMIGLYFSEKPPTRVPFTIRLSAQDIDIPAGAPRHVVEDRYVLPADVELHEVQPHAHYLAREVHAVARLPGGEERPLIYISDWDFNWQNVYRLARPMALPKGTELSMRYVFDNSAGNVRNPNRPPRRVRWGQESSDEMAELWLQVFPRVPADLAVLERDFTPKMLREDLTGFQNLLDADPGNPRLHEAVAFCQMQLGQLPVALDHLRASVRLDPRSAYGHYNLGTALVAAGDLAMAADAFERAVALRPQFASAHNNLGSVLWSLGHRERAVQHYRQAVSLEPNHGNAYKNLATSLAAVGDIPEALVIFRRAVALLPDDAELLQQAAWILAAHPDRRLRQPQEAIRLAEHAAALTHQQNPRVLDVLAVALASASQFDRAVTTATAALSLASATADRSLIAQIESRLRLYQQQRPYLLDLSGTSILEVR